MTDFYFVRHGQTTANAQGLKQGTINSEITNLSRTGKQQAQHLHDHFSIDFADQMVVSPLQRTLDTANIINQTAQLPITIDDRLLEISYGKWDGQKNDDLRKQHPEVFDDVLNDVLPTYATLADGETFDHVIERVNELMKDYANRFPNQKIIFVTHGFTIKSAVLAAIGSYDNPMVVAEPDNTSITHIVLSNDHYYLLKYNQTF